MNKHEIDRWAKEFAASLEVGGERVPLDRVLAAHLLPLHALRSSGLTWSAIASIIARAGGRRKNGRPISADQLRVDVSRLTKRGPKAAMGRPSPLSDTASEPDHRTARTSTKVAFAQRTVRADKPSSRVKTPETTARSSKDISDAEIAAALARIQKT